MKSIRLVDHLKEKGFMCYVSSPSKEEYEKFCELQKKTGNKNMKFKPFVPVCYEKQLTRITSLIIEGWAEKNVYYYDFYKITFFPKRSEGSNIKIYGRRMTRYQLLRCVEWVKNK